MEIFHFTTGQMDVNTYIIKQPDNNECFIIDPGGENESLISYLTEKKLIITHILLTHGHFDHIEAVRTLKERYGASIYIHTNDSAMLSDPTKNLSSYLNQSIVQPDADHYLTDESEIQIGKMVVNIIYTPGHSKGSVCYLCENILFSGDTLFKGSIGRSDFPDSDFNELQNSLKKLLLLNPSFLVYPGHGEFTTLEVEMKQNPFLLQVNNNIL